MAREVHTVGLGSGTTFAAIIASGALLGLVTAAAVPTAAVFTRSAQSAPITSPEDYPELVGVTYDAMSGPYYAPKAYSGIAPTIRDNIYDLPSQPAEYEEPEQYADIEYSTESVRSYEDDESPVFEGSFSDQVINEADESAL